MIGGRSHTSPAREDVLRPACIILIFYFVFEYTRPQYSLAPFLSYLRIPMILTIILFVIFLKSDKEILKDRLVVYTTLFIAEIAFSVIYAVNTYYVWKAFFGMAIMLLAVILVMPVICNNMQRLIAFFNTWIWIHVFVAGYSMLHGGHGPGGFLLDENDLSLTFNMALPLPLYLSMSPTITSKRKNIYRFISLLLIVCIGVTMSRGGFLGLLSVFGIIWLLSLNKIRTLFRVLLVVLILGYPVYKMIPDTYINEMSTITDKSDGTRLQREYFWGIAWDMFLDNPVLGVGAENYPWNVAKYQMRRPEYDPDKVTLFGGRPAHSLYFTLMPELGLLGIILYIMILYQILVKLKFVIRLGKNNAEFIDEMLMAKALLVSTGTFLITGAFISVLYYPPFWYLVGFVLTLHSITSAEIEQT